MGGRKDGRVGWNEDDLIRLENVAERPLLYAASAPHEHHTDIGNQLATSRRVARLYTSSREVHCRRGRDVSRCDWWGATHLIRSEHHPVQIFI